MLRFAAAVTLSVFTSAALASLQNPGFEDGVLDGSAIDWRVDAAANPIVVVDTEDGAEFSVYGPALLNLSVAPYRGDATAPDLMLRLGVPETPGDQNNNQADGTTAVSQHFVATAPELVLATRIFSTEFRRNRDALSIELVADSGAAAFPMSSGDRPAEPFSVALPGASCTTTPCRFELDAGKNGQIFDSGWTTFRISGLNVGDGYTLSYRMLTGGGSSHPSWVYFDDVNQPPIADFACNPGGRSGTVALEGDFIGCDARASSDPDGDPLFFSWTITGSALAEPLRLAGPVAGFYAPQDGDYAISLEVSDGVASSSQSTGSPTGFLAAPSSVDNAPPLVSAVDVEALGPTVLRCRGVDPGAADTHSVAISVAGTELDVALLAENEAAYATFAATAAFDASGLSPGDYPGLCAVDDGGTDGQRSAAFTMTVLDPAALLNRFEPNELPSQATLLNAGQTRLARLETADDVDFYELRMADGSVPPTNAEFLVRIRMPADYDALLLSRPTAGQSATVFQSAPFVSFPFVSFPFVSFPFVSFPFVSFPEQTAPFVSFPQQTAPFVSFPFVSFPFVSFPLETSPFVSFPFEVADFPLTQMADAPRGTEAAGDLVGFGELGSLNIAGFEDENLRVKSISANLNTRDDPEETLLGVKSVDEEAVYLAVISFDGALSPDAYQVTVEAHRPLDAARTGGSTGTEQLLGQNCLGSPLVTPSTAAVETVRQDSAPRTLVVTQRQRLQQLEGLSDADFDTLLAQLEPWMSHEDIRARFVSLPSHLYDAWDSAPCNLEPLRGLADQIGELVRAELTAYPTIDNVIILGDFDTLPSDIAQDFTAIGNEGLFIRDLPVRPETPIAAVFRGGQFLTDACFTDADPIPFNGGLVCLEDLPTGRLVSTDRMLQEAASYLATNGIINFTSGLVTGYEFFSDVAENMAASLSRLGPVTSLNNDQWTSGDLESLWCPVPGPPVSSIQGHASYNAILASGGFTAADFSDVTNVEECLGSGAGTLVASIGCHTATPVPASSALPAELFSSDPALTWTDRPGTWVGTMAFGLGHTDTDDLGTEGILKRFFACLGEGSGASIGDCVVDAKLGYLQSRTSIDAYDVKSVMTLGLFGIPRMTVVGAGGAATAGAAAVGAPAGTLDLTVLEAGSATQTFHAIERVDTAAGSYFTVDGQFQAGTGRPFLPTLEVLRRTLPAGTAGARSMALREGDYQLLVGFDPLNGNLKTEWIDPASEAESKACVATMAPTELGVINLLPVGGALREVFNLTAAQFECTLPPDQRGVADAFGNKRKFERLDVELIRPEPGLEADLDPPDVLRRDIVANASTGDALALVDAFDENGMAEINVLVYDEDREFGGPGQVRSFSTGDISGQAGPHEVFLPGGAGKFIAIEYFDRAGNKILKSGKGILVEVVEVVIRASTFTPGNETLLRVEIERLAEFLGAGLTLTIDYGDGTPTETFVLDENTAGVTLRADGSGVFETSHVFATAAATVTVTATLRGAASGYDEAVLGGCVDPAFDQALADGDLVTCGFSASGTEVDVDMYVRGVISDDFKYRVRLLGGQFQYAKGKLSRPPGVRGRVTSLGSDGLRFSFDAGDLGWDGVAPLTIELLTQAGVPGAPSDGSTDTKTFTASGGAPEI